MATPTHKQTLTRPAPPVLLTQAEALALATSLEERLQLLAAGTLDAKTLAELRALCTGQRPYGVDLQSGGWVYHFYIYRRGRRLAVTKRRAPRDRAIEQLALTVTSSYSCPECHRTFPRRGRRRYCSQRCKVAFRRRKRNGRVWSPENLSPEATANVEVARAVRQAQDEQRQRLARIEQEMVRHKGFSRWNIRE
jgi:hypothetical protein